MRPAKLCFVLALLLSFAGPADGEPKAYDLINYRGKADGLTIAFDLGCGYVEASEMRIKSGRRGKTVRFVLVSGEQMRFVPEKNRDGGDEVTLEMSPDDCPDEKVQGAYRTAGKTIRFTLTQQE